MADLQNDTFSKKVKTLLESLPQQKNNPLNLLKMSMENWGVKASLREKFSLKEISLSDTSNLLRSLGNTKSFGLDTLDAMSLKVVAVYILSPLNHLINLLIRTCDFAAQWKIGCLVPLHKGKGAAKTDPDIAAPSCEQVSRKSSARAASKLHGNLKTT